MKTKMIGYLKIVFALALVVVCSCSQPTSELQAQETGKFTDTRDGKTYKTVKIGDLWIMSENFAYKPEKGKYWAYNNDSANVAKYGYLYDWETAKQIAPKGWHLPSEAEFKVIKKACGGKRDVFKYLGGTMEKVYKQLAPGGKSGFNAQFGGEMRFGGFRNITNIGDYWSSTNAMEGPTHYIIDSKKDGKATSFLDSKDGVAYLGSCDAPTSCKSVRLIKDNETITK